jgi:hypothetical protein
MHSLSYRTNSALVNSIIGILLLAVWSRGRTEAFAKFGPPILYRANVSRYLKRAAY